MMTRAIWRCCKYSSQSVSRSEYIGLTLILLGHIENLKRKLENIWRHLTSFDLTWRHVGKAARKYTRKYDSSKVLMISHMRHHRKGIAIRNSSLTRTAKRNGNISEMAEIAETPRHFSKRNDSEMICIRPYHLKSFPFPFLLIFGKFSEFKETATKYWYRKPGLVNSVRGHHFFGQLDPRVPIKVAKTVEFQDIWGPRGCTWIPPSSQHRSVNPPTRRPGIIFCRSRHNFFPS